MSMSHSEFSIVVPVARVSAPLGSSVVLPCGLFPSFNAKYFDIRWYRNGDYENVVLLYQDQNISPGDQWYRTRVSLIGELDRGNISLKLDNITVVDAGDYTCFVKSISWYEKGSMKLVVKGMRKPDSSV